MTPPLAAALPVSDLAQTRGIREALQWFTREKQWINEQHLELCRIPAPTFLEHQRAEWMAAQFRALGCEAQVDRAGNVIAFLDSGGHGPLVALTAHLDTVIAPKSRDDVAVEASGRFRGPGVADNGAGLAALMAVARALKSGPDVEDRVADLVFVANVGEEGEGNLSGMRYLCKQSPLAKRISSFLVLDGADTAHITTQALGSRRFEIAFTGPGGHSWSDHGTANPVHALARAIAQLAEIRLNGSPRTALNVGLIEGGSSVNSIPALARAKVDIRSEDNPRIDELARVLQEAVEQAQDRENERASGGKVAGKVKEIGARPAGQLPVHAPILQYLRAVDAHLGIRSFPDCASTDANIPLSMGIPAVSIGAGGHGGGAHTAQEWFLPDGRDLALKRILLTLAALLRDPSAP
ncbi:MAG: M20/M25/M40 family metallo-hydrolase [Acidobacteria bacterium]|nr:M20/M25/M40 family metallo-hydrolase [Acidobacteriota bacterium]MBI3471352.1 M20/M25/M40 family metallo-hydrolase [Candidatus Solibacter usitatus]